MSIEQKLDKIIQLLENPPVKLHIRDNINFEPPRHAWGSKYHLLYTKKEQLEREIINLKDVHDKYTILMEKQLVEFAEKNKSLTDKLEVHRTLFQKIGSGLFLKQHMFNWWRSEIESRILEVLK